MENISLVTWDDVFMLDKNLAAEWGYVVDSINIHEMAHRLRPLGSLLCVSLSGVRLTLSHRSSCSYFGDALVIRHFEHAWLKV